MRLHFPRQGSGGCDAGKSFYRCAKGPYSGCCSTNPCDTGTCGDDSSSNPVAAKTSNNPSTTDSASSTTDIASRSSAATKSTSALTSTASTKPTSTSAALHSTASRTPATSTSAIAIPSSTSQLSNTTRPPVGAIAGGVIGGLALLGLLAALLWCCLKRKSKLRLGIGRAKNKVNGKRGKELLEAETAILEREKFLDAAKQKAEPEVKGGDPFAEFGGYHRDNNSDNTAGRPGYRFYNHHNQLSSSNSASSQAQKPLPAINTTPAPTPNPSTVLQTGMPLSSIPKKDQADSIPILDGTEVPRCETPVDTYQTGLNQQGLSQNGTVASRTPLHVDPLATSKGRRMNVSTRTSRTQSAEFSSISSNPHSYANTGSPVSPAQPKDFGAPDGAVMRSNLNGSWNRRARQGSVRKHVMSFMEYDTENDSLCSSSRRCSLKVPGKALLPGDQGRGPEHQDPSWRR